MHYRAAVPNDAPTLADINRQLIEDEWGGGGMSLERLEARIRGWLEEDDHRALIFEEDGAMVAYALVILDEDSAYIRHFFVLRAHRGRGIGRRVMEVLLREVIPPGARITLDVLASNRTGHRFWRSMGFGDYSVRMERLPAGARATAGAAEGADSGDAAAGVPDAATPDDAY